mmetsp:Transcript_17973/g.20780  ORF Transcript_17973/g.20780 Transcript_17973/m.20780 type:complete len:120 (+) Transcript_17973:105-464(+)
MFFIITNVILLLTFPMIHAFTPLSSTTITSSKIPITKINYAKRNHSLLQMAGGGGDFFSAILGQAPKIINVPVVEILQGTNIDPEKSNVDLQCVYKASKDGWSAIDFHNCCDGRGEYYR